MEPKEFSNLFKRKGGRCDKIEHLLTLLHLVSPQVDLNFRFVRSLIRQYDGWFESPTLVRCDLPYFQLAFQLVITSLLFSKLYVARCVTRLDAFHPEHTHGGHIM